MLATPGAVKGKNRLSKGVESYGAESEKPKRKWKVRERT